MEGKRVAVCLFGISYKPDYSHWIAGTKSIDYRDSLNNYKNRIFSNLISYDIYCSTYDNELITQLQIDLNFISCAVCKEEIRTGLDKEPLIQRNNIIGFFENLLSGKTYDYYIFTRFDLYFNFDINTLIVDNNKINVLTSLEQDNLLCDNFYIIHNSKLKEFLTYIKNKNINSYNRHDCEFFGGMDNIHLMLPEKGKRINMLNSYKIIRNGRLCTA